MVSTLPKVEILKSLYSDLVYPRLIEEKMLILLRQGKISKWFSGIGQEAISVGATAALAADEIIFTMHRNLGVFTTRRMPLDDLFCQWQGTSSGYTKGRDRSFHFGNLDYHIVGMISHLGPQLSLADGVGLAHKLKSQKKVTLAFTGEGATSQGEFHEALNVAAVWKLPVIFLVENNGYGLSTPIQEQFACENIASKGLGYGMRSLTIDGNNLLEVYQTVKTLADEMRSHPEPVLLECMTFRMRGHEEASGTKYVPSELFEIWGEKDPILSYEAFLRSEGIMSDEEMQNIKAELKQNINQQVEHGLKDSPVAVSELTEINDVYAPFSNIAIPPQSEDRSEMRYVDAVSDALKVAMLRHDQLVFMGQDIAEYGGAFKITAGLVEQFGRERVRNTPLCESAIVGSALGLSLMGMKSMVEMQFSDFVTCGFNQIVNNLAKLNYRWGQNADVVIRMPTGGGVAAGPFHSQSTEAWFTHVPGLKIVYPSNPYDAKGLLLQSFEDPNPIMYFEHKALYRKSSGLVPDGFYTVPFGSAHLITKGEDVTIITYGMGVSWAESLIPIFPDQSIEIIDLRTLVPLDYDTIQSSVRKTGKVMVLHEDTLFGGIGGEIAAYISEHLFEYLDAPVMRCGSLDTPIPFTSSLEQQFMALSRAKTVLQKLINY